VSASCTIRKAESSTPGASSRGVPSMRTSTGSPASRTCATSVSSCASDGYGEGDVAVVGGAEHAEQRAHFPQRLRRGLLDRVDCTPLLFAACGGDDSKTNAVELRGEDYAFVVSETIEGGWTTSEFTNTGREWHEFALAKPGAGKTVADVQRYLADPKSQQQPPPARVRIRAGIPTLDADEEAALTQRLEPGRYVLLRFLDAPDGRTHIEHGMVRAFVADADVPEPDATLKLGAWRAAPQLDAGRTIELRNDRDQPVSVFLTSLERGKTEQDLERRAKGGMRGPAPARFLGGAIDVPPHTSVYYRVALEQGREYTLLDDERGVQGTFTPS
jgi:hypothetical protein